MLNVIKSFLAPVPKTIRGILLPEELFRSVLTAFGSGSLMGLLLVALQAVLSSVAVIFPSPIVASLATAILTIVVDQVRRLEQRSTPISALALTPNPTLLDLAHLPPEDVLAQVRIAAVLSPAV
jgi:hypothetical protein